MLAVAAVPPKAGLAAATAPSETPASAGLSWEACMAEARQHNPDLRAARFKLEAAGIRRSSQLGSWLPRVDVGLSQDRGRTYPEPGSGAPGYGARLSASQSLFEGFATLAETAKAGVDYRKARNAYRKSEAEIRHGLREAFVEALGAQDLALLRESLAARRKENSRLVADRLAAKQGDDSVRLQAEAEVGKADFEVARSRRGLARARQKLARAMGRSTATQLVLSGDWTPAPPPREPNLAGLAETVPAVVDAVAEVDSARLGEQEARAAFWPSLEASGAVSRDGPGFPPSESRGWSAGVSLSLNLFNRTKDHAAVRIARLEADTADAELVAARRDAVSSLEETLEPYENAFEAVEVRRKSAEAARARAADARDKYVAGTMEFDQWTEIESGLGDAEVEYLDARKEALNTEAGWLKATGTGFP